MQSFLRQGQSPHRDPVREKSFWEGCTPRHQFWGRESLLRNALPFPKPLSLVLVRAAALLVLLAAAAPALVVASRTLKAVIHGGSLLYRVRLRAP